MASTHRRILEEFRSNDQPSTLEKDKEKKVFFELQNYNLLRLNSEGKIIITPQGEEAISVGVEKYIRTLKFERELAKKAPKLKREKKILTLLVIILSLSLIFLLFFDTTDTLLSVL